jgi:ABC-type lipoprotein export system ATPase subunit
MPGARVVLEGVTREYDGAAVLRDVDLEIAPGALVTLSGPSGSGKTTLLNIVGSLDRPTRGRVLVDDVSVGDLARPAHFRRDVVGFVFQEHHLVMSLTARENVELPMTAARVPRAERTPRADALLEEVGLGGLGNRLPAELSGGERQRVAIARALANRPRLVLADEPTGALDSEASRRVWDQFRELHDRYGSTVIVASHDSELAGQTDRQVRLFDGALVA